MYIILSNKETKVCFVTQETNVYIYSLTQETKYIHSRTKNKGKYSLIQETKVHILSYTGSKGKSNF